MLLTSRAHGGSYSVYRALAIAMNALDPNHKPDYTNTHPPFEIPPSPSLFNKDKIVSLDPWGHMAQTIFKSVSPSSFSLAPYRADLQHIDSGLDVKPTISCTKAHIKMTELDLANSTGSIKVDGKIVTNSQILPAFPENDPGIEVNTYKAAIEPVWHLPGLAKRFEVSEELLRRALFEGKSMLVYFTDECREDEERKLIYRNWGNVPRTPYPPRP
jgi:copper chaperone CopZ